MDTFKWSKEELADYFEVPVELLCDESTFACAEKLRNDRIKFICKLAVKSKSEESALQTACRCNSNFGNVSKCCLKGKEGERGWADNTSLDDKIRWFTKDSMSVDCPCKLIQFGTDFVMDYKVECPIHGI